MNTLTKLSLASALALSAAFGLAQAQQANQPAPTPPGPAAQCDGPDAGQDCDGQMADSMDGDEQGGMHGMMHGRDGGGRHGMGHDGGHGRGKHGGRAMRMRMLDANGDGVIGADEAAALAEGTFMRFDQDRDGKLTETEFTAGPRGMQRMRGWFNWGSEEQAAVDKVRKDRFARLDANKDGSLTKAEFFVDAESSLAAADTNKDGKVTPWEFRASR